MFGTFEFVQTHVLFDFGLVTLYWVRGVFSFWFVEFWLKLFCVVLRLCFRGVVLKEIALDKKGSEGLNSLHTSMICNTLPKTNLSPENYWLEDDISFWVLVPLLRGHSFIFGGGGGNCCIWGRGRKAPSRSQHVAMSQGGKKQRSTSQGKIQGWGYGGRSFFSHSWVLEEFWRTRDW